MTRPISESARKMMAAMAYRMEHRPVADDRLETLIAWVQGHEAILEGYGQDILNALVELQTNRRLA